MTQIDQGHAAAAPPGVTTGFFDGPPVKPSATEGFVPFASVHQLQQHQMPHAQQCQPFATSQSGDSQVLPQLQQQQGGSGPSSGAVSQEGTPFAGGAYMPPQQTSPQHQGQPQLTALPQQPHQQPQQIIMLAPPQQHQQHAPMHQQQQPLQAFDAQGQPVFILPPQMQPVFITPPGQPMPFAGAPMPARQVIVNFLAPEVTSADLASVFQGIGPIDCARVIVDKVTGVSKQFGFVYFKRPEDAARSVHELTGFPMLGRRIKVTIASSQRPQ